MLRKLSAKPLNFQAAAKNKNLVMHVYDMIGSDFFGDGITSQTVAEALKTPHDSVTVHINSPGGDAFHGVAIYNLLKANAKPVNVIVDGLAASAASIVAMAGDTITMGLGTQMMIHPAMMMAMGDASELRKGADVLDQVTTSMADIYAQRTKQPQSKIVDMMNAETWMNPEDAMANGFCDACTETPSEAKAVAANFDLSAFKNTPKELKPVTIGTLQVELKIDVSEILNRTGLTKKVDGENLTADDFVYVGKADQIDTWHLPWRFSTEEKTQSHLRDALARFDQTAIPPTKKAAARAKLESLAKEHGIDVAGEDESAGESNSDKSDKGSTPEANWADPLVEIELHRKRIEILRQE